jgi:hypothetical protein
MKELFDLFKEHQVDKHFCGLIVETLKLTIEFFHSIKSISLDKVTFLYLSVGSFQLLGIII